MLRLARCAVIMLFVALCLPGCIVLAVNRFYDETTMTSDERLIGTWKDVDDNVDVTIDASEWRSYRISYTHPIQKGVLTGYLFKAGNAEYLDLTVARGEDPGTFVVAGHTVVRVAFDGDRLRVAPLAHAWFMDGRQTGALATLAPELTDRDQVVLSASARTLQAWLAGRAENDSAFGPAAVFTKQP
jgi:hypothetical protein